MPQCRTRSQGPICFLLLVANSTFTLPRGLEFSSISLRSSPWRRSVFNWIGDPTNNVITRNSQPATNGLISTRGMTGNKCNCETWLVGRRKKGARYLRHVSADAVDNYRLLSSFFGRNIWLLRPLARFDYYNRYLGARARARARCADCLAGPLENCEERPRSVCYFVFSRGEKYRWLHRCGGRTSRCRPDPALEDKWSPWVISIRNISGGKRRF